MTTQTIDFSTSTAGFPHHSCTQLDGVKLDAMTEGECEAWMERATGIRIGTPEGLKAPLPRIPACTIDASFCQTSICFLTYSPV